MYKAVLHAAPILVLLLASTASGQPLGDRPEDAPVLVSKDGKLYATFEIEKKVACDPEDEYDEGLCDWKVRMVVRSVADKKKVDAMSFTWGNYKAKTNLVPIKASWSKHGLELGTPGVMNSDQRRYDVGSSHQVVIDGHKRRVRLRVLDKRSQKAIFTTNLPKRCAYKGKRTIWGAKTFVFPSSGKLVVADPRACKKPHLEIVDIKKEH